MGRKQSVINDIISENLIARGMRVEDFANALDVTTRTVENRWNHPEKWTLDQIQRICKLFKVTNAQKVKLLS